MGDWVVGIVADFSKIETKKIRTAELKAECLTLFITTIAKKNLDSHIGPSVQISPPIKHPSVQNRRICPPD
jgi:hypothetical protein